MGIVTRLPSPLWGGRTRPKAEPGGGVGADLLDVGAHTPTPDLRFASARPSPRASVWIPCRPATLPWRKASDWCAANGLLVEAGEYSLQAHDIDNAIVQMERCIDDQIRLQARKGCQHPALEPGVGTRPQNW